jgi:hypothetical protein
LSGLALFQKRRNRESGLTMKSRGQTQRRRVIPILDFGKMRLFAPDRPSQGGQGYPMLLAPVKQRVILVRSCHDAII